jgi:hypothetical protein
MPIRERHIGGAKQDKQTGNFLKGTLSFSNGGPDFRPMARCGLSIIATGSKDTLGKLRPRVSDG